jgi:hypothetical protein
MDPDQIDRQMSSIDRKNSSPNHSSAGGMSLHNVDSAQFITIISRSMGHHKWKGYQWQARTSRCVIVPMSGTSWVKQTSSAGRKSDPEGPKHIQAVSSAVKAYGLFSSIQ